MRKCLHGNKKSQNIETSAIEKKWNCSHGTLGNIFLTGYKQIKLLLVFMAILKQAPKGHGSDGFFYSLAH